MKSSLAILKCLVMVLSMLSSVELMPGRGGNRSKTPLLWVDLEMTGLNVGTDHIIEVAFILTDGDLNIIEEGPNMIIHQPKEVMDRMNDWCIEHHGKSGLTANVLASNYTIQDAEEQVLAFLEKHNCEKGVIPLAGNTVHADRAFMLKEMPRVTDFLHFRILDVSSVNEITKRWYPSMKNYRKKYDHRALDDIKESIEELKYYRKAIFKEVLEEKYIYKKH